MKNKRPLEITNDVLINYAYGLLAPDVAMQVRQALEKEEILLWQYEGIVALIKRHPDKHPGELLEQMANRAGQNIKAAIVNKAPKATHASRRWLLAAAVLIVLAGIGIFINIQKKNDADKQLASAMIKNSEVNPYSNATRGSITSTDSATAWKEAFIKNNFDRVIFLQKNKSLLSNEAQFFLALAYLKTTPAQPAQAESLLKQLTVSTNEYTSDAWLYLGLAQALQNKNTAALQSLRHVVQTTQVKDLEERLRK